MMETPSPDPNLVGALSAESHQTLVVLFAAIAAKNEAYRHALYVMTALRGYPIGDRLAVFFKVLEENKNVSRKG